MGFTRRYRRGGGYLDFSGYSGSQKSARVAQLFSFLAIAATVAMFALTFAALNSTKWIVTCFNTREMLMISPRALQNSPGRLNDLNKDSESIKQQVGLCMESGPVNFGFSVPTIASYSVGTFGVSFSSVTLALSLLLTVIAAVFALLGAITLRRHSVAAATSATDTNCTDTSTKGGSKCDVIMMLRRSSSAASGGSAEDPPTIRFLKIANKFCRINAIILTVSMVYYTADQLSTASADAHVVGPLGDVSTKKLSVFSHPTGDQQQQQPQGGANWRNESSNDFRDTPHISSSLINDIRLILNNMERDVIKKAEEAAAGVGEAREGASAAKIQRDFVNFRFSIQPCFGRAFYWVWLVWFLCFVAMFCLQVVKMNVRRLVAATDESSDGNTVRRKNSLVVL